jgi:hypothetical protein
MRRENVRTLFVCLFAVCALGALLAGGASAALPEWGGCEPSAPGHGKYKDPACIEKATGAAKKTEGDYEWYSGAAFGWVNEREHGLDHPYGIEEYDLDQIEIGATTFETTSGQKIECAGSGPNPIGKNQIQLEAPNRIKGVKLTFIGCHESSGPGEEGAECQSPGLEGDGPEYEGLITDAEAARDGEALKGQLVFISGKGGGSPQLGLALTSFYKPGQVVEKEYEVENPVTEEIEIKKETVVESGHLFEAVCSGSHGIGTVWIGGSKHGKNTIISLISPVDEMVGEGEPTTAFSQLFKGTGGIQEPSAAERGGEQYLTETLENNVERSAWNSPFTDPPEAEAPPIEIKARP